MPGLTLPAGQRAADAFRHWHGRQPWGVWSAPGRINLIGEHTDYNSGLALPFALSRRTAVAAAPRSDGMLHLTSLGSDGQPHPAPPLRLAELAPGTASGWSAYPAGVAWALRQAGLDVGGADLVVAGDVPSGAGLASSHALECAAALALLGLAGLEVDRVELAGLVQRAENEFVGAPTGILDQTAALLCTAGHALLLDTRAMRCEQLPCDLAGAGCEVLVIDTRVHHANLSSGYRERRSGCERAARLLGVSALREVTEDDLDQALARLSGELHGLVRHVVGENARVLHTAALLRRGAVIDTGPLLTASHASLRDDYQVSCPELNTAVEAALGAGALGARMTGGGFGGSAIALVPTAALSEVRAAVRQAFASRHHPTPRTFAAAPSAGAGREA